MRAAAVLRSHDLTLSEQGDALIAQLRRGDDRDLACSGLNRALVEAGVGVFAITPRARSLEGIYRQVSSPNLSSPQPEPV